MLGNIVLVGNWKLSQWIIPLVSCKTRFPESKSLAFELTTEFVAFDDQIIRSCPSKTTRFPSSDIVTTPEASFRGFCQLATHTHWAEKAEFLLYHIPRYRLVEFTGLKNPNLKVLPLAIM